MYKYKIFNKNERYSKTLHIKRNRGSWKIKEKVDTITINIEVVKICLKLKRITNKN